TYFQKEKNKENISRNVQSISHTPPQQVQFPITLTPKRKARRVVTSVRSTSLEPSTVVSVAEESSDKLEEKVEQDEDARTEITQGTNVTGGRRRVVRRLRQSTQSVADTEYTAVSFGTNKNVESKDCPKANITPLEAVHMAAIANWVEKMGHGAPYYGLIMYSVNENILGNDLVIEILEYVRKRVSESTSYVCLDELEDPDSYTSIWCTKLMERIILYDKSNVYVGIPHVFARWLGGKLSSSKTRCNFEDRGVSADDNYWWKCCPFTPAEEDKEYIFVVEEEDGEIMETPFASFNELFVQNGSSVVANLTCSVKMSTKIDVARKGSITSEGEWRMGINISRVNLIDVIEVSKPRSDRTQKSIAGKADKAKPRLLEKMRARQSKRVF
ncbi:hypothetical protein GcM3_165016, partial [Golovinomyces cichoracearum]